MKKWFAEASEVVIFDEKSKWEGPITALGLSILELFRVSFFSKSLLPKKEGGKLLAYFSFLKI
jgi:hypothetical protein